MASEDNNCPICASDMQHKSYDVASETEKEVSDTAYRLLCGHAFHYSCLFLYQRHDSVRGCPICIDKEPPTHEVNGEIITLDLTYPYIEEELGTLRRANELLTQAGRIHSVQIARRDFNTAMKEYRGIENELKVDRSQVIQNTLKKFKDLSEPKFQKSFKKLKKKLKDLRDKEVFVVNKLDPTFNFTRDNAGTFANYSIRDVLDTAFGPLKRSFWQ